MPATAYIGTEIDSKIADAATKVLRESGFTLSEVIRLMIAKTARDSRLPFDADEALKEEYGDEFPNDLTKATMEKVLKGEELHKAKNLDDLIRQLDA